MSENTPETRLEMANHRRQSNKQGTENNHEIKKCEINLFNKEGKPKNINEAKINFSFTEDEESNCFVLTLEVYK